MSSVIVLSDKACVEHLQEQKVLLLPNADVFPRLSSEVQRFILSSAMYGPQNNGCDPKAKVYSEKIDCNTIRDADVKRVYDAFNSKLSDSKLTEQLLLFFYGSKYDFLNATDIDKISKLKYSYSQSPVNDNTSIIRSKVNPTTIRTVSHLYHRIVPIIKTFMESRSFVNNPPVFSTLRVDSKENVYVIENHTIVKKSKDITFLFGDGTKQGLSPLYEKTIQLCIDLEPFIEKENPVNKVITQIDIAMYYLVNLTEKIPYLCNVTNLLYVLLHGILRKRINVSKLNYLEHYLSDKFHQIKGLEDDILYPSGVNNNLTCPFMGSENTPFERNTTKVITAMPVERAKYLAKMLLHRKTEKSTDKLNALVAAWIQFMTHDWFNHNDNVDNTINTVSAHWQANQIYGSSVEEEKQLRNGCYLKLDAIGVNRNMWTGLLMLHQLFVLEHNYVCDLLKKDTKLSDEEIFQKAKLIIAAAVAKIHTIDWTTSILSRTPNVIIQNMLINGLVKKKKIGEKVIDTNNYELGLIINGLMGSENKYSSMYNHTEEFVSVYRMHELLPDNLIIGGYDYKLHDILFDNAEKPIQKHGLSNVVKGFGCRNLPVLVLQNDPLYDVDINGKKTDLAEVFLIRNSERKIPKFNDFRDQVGLPKYKTFEELNSDPEIVKALKSCYSSVDDIDFHIGIKAEQPYAGLALGWTTYTIFMIQTSKRLETNRFFGDSFNEKNYTKTGIEYIQDINFSNILLRHCPTLHSHITSSTNAFHHWLNDLQDVKYYSISYIFRD